MEAPSDAKLTERCCAFGQAIPKVAGRSLVSRVSLLICICRELLNLENFIIMNPDYF
jgi:hypothetical protein